MFPRSYFPGHHFAPRYWGEGGAGAPPTPPATGSRGRLLVRWLLEIPPVKNPMGEYVWRREKEEVLFL